MALDVFISYSSLDKATADAVCNQLESAGISCWIAPRDILPSSLRKNLEIGALLVFFSLGFWGGRDVVSGR